MLALARKKILGNWPAFQLHSLCTLRHNSKESMLYGRPAHVSLLTCWKVQVLENASWSTEKYLHTNKYFLWKLQYITLCLSKLKKTKQNIGQQKSVAKSVLILLLLTKIACPQKTPAQTLCWLVSCTLAPTF